MAIISYKCRYTQMSIYTNVDVHKCKRFNTDVAGAHKWTMSLFPKCPLYCVADYLDNEKNVQLNNKNNKNICYHLFSLRC